MVVFRWTYHSHSVASLDHATCSPDRSKFPIKWSEENVLSYFVVLYTFASHLQAYFIAAWVARRALFLLVRVRDNWWVPVPASIMKSIFAPLPLPPPPTPPTHTQKQFQMRKFFYIKKWKNMVHVFTCKSLDYIILWSKLRS